MDQSQLIAAMNLLQAGELDSAAAAYRAILEISPLQPEGHYYLGVIANYRGQQDEALVLINKAIELLPQNGLFYYGKAVVLQQQKQWETAMAAYRQALLLQPNLADAHLNLARLYQENNQLAEAQAQYQALLNLLPDNAYALNQLGNIAKVSENWELAKHFYQQALLAEPAFVEASNNLGMLFQFLNQLEDAILAYNKGLEHRPDVPQLHNNLGNVFKAKGESAAAKKCYEEAIRLDLNYASPYRHLAILFRNARQIEAAIQYFEIALKLRPDSLEAWLDLGDTWLMKNCTQQAIHCYEQALSLEDRDAIRIKLARVLPRIYQSQADVLFWRERFTQQFAHLAKRPIYLKNPISEVGAANFYLAYQGMDNCALHQTIGQLFAHAADWKSVTFRRNIKPKIGFLSTYFVPGHTIAKLFTGLIERLSREHFEVFVYRPENKSPFIIQAPSHLVSFNPENLNTTCDRVAKDGLDILFYPDIGMEPLTYFMGFNRLAPLQCVSWGHPDTTGIPSIDYFISSRLLELPHAQSYYTEKLALLETLPVYYDRPQLPEDRYDRAYFGLSETAHLYLCPQTLFKFYPDFDALLANILRNDPQGQLILVNANFPGWADMLLQRFQKSMPDVWNRVQIFQQLNQQAFFSLLNLADVVLDTLYFGGGNTTYETLALGTPIVTWPQSLMRSRITYGCYRKMGILETVADSAEDYVGKAVQLGCDQDYRNQLKQRILERCPVIFEDREAVRQLESFFLEALASPASSA